MALAGSNPASATEHVSERSKERVRKTRMRKRIVGSNPTMLSKNLNMLDFKLTGDIHNDIDVVYDAVNYVQSLVSCLQEEWEGQKLGISTEYLEILDVTKSMKGAANSIDKVRNWHEPKRFYGTLAEI